QVGIVGVRIRIQPARLVGDAEVAAGRQPRREQERLPYLVHDPEKSAPRNLHDRNFPRVRLFYIFPFPMEAKMGGRRVALRIRGGSEARAGRICSASRESYVRLGPSSAPRLAAARRARR